MDSFLSTKAQTRLWVAAFLIATFGTGVLKTSGIVAGWPGVVLFLASFLILIPMVRAAERSAKAQGGLSEAMRRYNRRVLVSALAYVGALFAGMGVARHFEPSVAVRVVLAGLVALPVIGIVRAMALLLREERDEYLKSRLVDQSLIATGFMLTIATLYGFLNAFDVAPRIDAWAAFPLWAIGLGIGRLLQRDGAS